MMKVLVVDDVGYMRHFLQRLLEEHGHSVLAAASGMAGLRMLEQDTNIRAVVCDLLMPDMDGIEFFQRAKTIERFTDQGAIPAPPFILLTALRPSDSSRTTEVQRLRQAAEIGFADIMLKPVDQKRLIAKLAEIESADSATADTAAETDNLQKNIASLRDVIESAGNSPSKDALLATLATLEAQLGEM